MEDLLLVSDVNPPGLSKSKSKALSSSGKDGAGQRLLALIRSIETNQKKRKHGGSGEDGDGDDTAVVDDHMLQREFQQQTEMLQLLQKVTVTISKCGLLRGDVESAELYLSKKTSAQKSTADRKSHKRKEAHANADSITSCLQDSNYMMAALLRMLQMEGSSRNPLHLKIYMAAADVLTATSEYIPTHAQTSACSVVEYDLLLEHGKALLTALVDALGVAILRADNIPHHASSCMAMIRAITSLLTLFQIKMSRATSLLQKIRQAAWRLVFVPHCGIQRASAKLLSVLPLTGAAGLLQNNSGNTNSSGSNNITNSANSKTASNDIWNTMTADCVVMIERLISEVAPVRGLGSGPDNDANSWREQRVQSWLDVLRAQKSHQLRVLQVKAYLTGLIYVLIALLQHDYGRASSNAPFLIGLKIDMEELLNLLETLLSFSLASESLYARTKRRLRQEIMMNGMLSPTMIACTLASHVKRLGYELLDTVLLQLGGPTALPYAARIIRIGYASLVTSCSGAVTSIIDPANSTGNGNNNGKKQRRWLHESIPMRRMAIQSLRIIVASFGYHDGSNSSSSNRSKKKNSTNDVEQGTRLVAGSLVEQLACIKQCASDGTQWGSSLERTQLIVTAAECLVAILQSCSGYLSDVTRSLVDGIARESLTLVVMHRHHTANNSVMTNAILDLASTCQLTPWSDGSSSSISGVVSETARQLLSSCDVRVIAAAQRALQICNLSSMSRAPPLKMVVANQSPGHEDHKGGGQNIGSKLSVNAFLNAMEQFRTNQQTERKRSAASTSEETSSAASKGATKRPKSSELPQPEQKPAQAAVAIGASNNQAESNRSKTTLIATPPQSAKKDKAGNAIKTKVTATATAVAVVPTPVEDAPIGDDDASQDNMIIEDEINIPERTNKAQDSDGNDEDDEGNSDNDGDDAEATTTGHQDSNREVADDDDGDDDDDDDDGDMPEIFDGDADSDDE